MMTPQPPPVFEVAGMRVGCTPYRALIKSTLECFFDDACLNATAQWISTLPDIDWPKPLNSSKFIRFSPNTPTADIFEMMLVEQWDVAKNFSAYYIACAPVECTYTLPQRNAFIYVITMIIGLFGGLAVGIDILSPIMIKSGRYIHSRFVKRNQSEVEPQEPQTGIVSEDVYLFFHQVFFVNGYEKLHLTC